MLELVEGNNWYWTSDNPKLSVLILTIPSRRLLLDRLLASLDGQKADGVEIIINCDDKTKTVGAKRQEALDAAKGQYIAYCDDDDQVSSVYIASLLAAVDDGADVITFDQRAIIDNSNPFTVSFSIRNENQPLMQKNGRYLDIKRKPFHMCAWKAEIAHRHRFDNVSYGEDWAWCQSMLREVRTENHLNMVLHYYEYDRHISECPG